MNDDQTLNRGIQIPHVDLNQRQQLQLYHQSQNTQNRNEYVGTNVVASTNRRSTTNSLSSLSHATQQSVLPTNTVDDSESISKVIDVCNEIDIEDDCVATESLVRKCIRNQIWATNKFVTDNTIKHMKIENRSNPKSVLNILLKYTRKQNLGNLGRLKFWKKYGGVVQLEVNVQKTVTSRAIKDELMIGKFVFYFYYIVYHY